MIQNDVCALIEVIKRFRDKGVLDPSGLNFNTVCDAEIFGKCRETCTQRICKKGDCRKRHLMLEVGQKFDAKPAPSMTPKPGPSKMSYEQREEMVKPSKADSVVLSYKQSQLSQAPSKREISNLSFQPSGMSQLSKILSSTTSYRGGSKVSQTQSHAGSLMQVSVGSQAPQNDDSQMPVDVGSQTSPSADSQVPVNLDSQMPANVDSRMPVNVDSRMAANVDSRIPVHVGSSYVSVQESNNQLRAGESISSYERTSYMDFPSKVEISTSMEKVSTISQSTSTGFVQEDVVMKSYSKMSHHMPQQMNHMPLEFNHMRPININLKLIREPSCCITSNQCCDCDCEPDCSSCICDCEY